LSHIIASLKTISVDGRLEIRDLMRRPNVIPTPALRAVIDRGLVHHLPLRSALGDDLEFESTARL
jgi:hypothetical protein